MYETDTLIIGAGVIGLATGAALAKSGRQVIVVEKEAIIGSGISSRNSEVIHGGLYYPTNSLKHRLCLEGRRKLYDYSITRGIPHKKTGKLIVATNDEEIGALQLICARAERNGVENIAFLDSGQACHLEPALSCVAAIHSPETGIVDSHALMLSLQGELEDHGGAIAFETPVQEIEPISGGGCSVKCGGRDPIVLRCRHLINAAGLHAHEIASAIESPAGATRSAFFLAKGNYFSCRSKPQFSTLIYPAPTNGGLGVHLTLDLQGRMRFGPDVEWLDSDQPDQIDYSIDPKRLGAFYDAVRKYWPELPDDSLFPDYAGCRPKLVPEGETAADFLIEGSSAHGVEGLINLLGIESPGLTAALALADHVANILENQ